MLEERDERCCNRCNLLGRYIHELYLVLGHDREVGVLTGLHTVVDEVAFVVDGGVALGNHLTLLDFGGEVCHVIVV